MQIQLNICQVWLGEKNFGILARAYLIEYTHAKCKRRNHAERTNPAYETNPMFSNGIIYEAI